MSLISIAILLLRLLYVQQALVDAAILAVAAAALLAGGSAAFVAAVRAAVIACVTFTAS